MSSKSFTSNGRQSITYWCMLLLTLAIPVVLLFSVSVAHAQYIEVTDNTCTAGSPCDGPSGQGCNSTTFTVTTAHTVQLCALIQCNSANCSDCLAVAYIYDSHGNMERCVHNDCGNTQRCENVPLAADDYTLYCCMLDCSGDDCGQCSSIYVARARVVMWPEP